MLIAVVGSASDVKENSRKFGPVDMYDEDGNPVVVKTAVAVTLTRMKFLQTPSKRTAGKQNSKR